MYTTKISKGFWITISIIVGLIFIPILYMMHIEHMESMNWPSTHGKIIQVDLIEGTNGRFTTCETPKVTYRYIVDGIPYISTDRIIGPEICYGNKADAVSIINRYPVGKEINVYYDHSNPLNAILER